MPAREKKQQKQLLATETKMHHLTRELEIEVERIQSKCNYFQKEKNNDETKELSVAVAGCRNSEKYMEENSL